MHVKHLGIRVVLPDTVADGVHKVRLAQPDAAIDEKRVVDTSGVVTDLHTGSAGKLVGFAFDETFEREIGVGTGTRWHWWSGDLCHDAVATARNSRA